MKSLVQFILEAQSKPTLDWMKEHYEKYNKELFDNELPSNIRLGLIVSKTDSLGWQGFDKLYYVWKHLTKNGMYISYIPKPGKETSTYYSSNDYDEVTDCAMLDPYIELNPKYQFSDFKKEDTLIHEMIHLWVSRHGLQPKRGHGKEFTNKCNEIREKAKKLYGVEYELTTYAKLDDNNYKIADDVQKNMKKDIIKASKRGGGVVSVYLIHNRDEMINNSLERKYPKRFFFCTKSMLSKMIEPVASSPGLKEVYISAKSYIPFVEKFGKIQTINKYGPFWDATQFDEDMFIDGAEMKKIFNESLITESLLSKLKDIVKRIMKNVFIKIDKKTPSSEINLEDMLNYAEEHDGEEQQGTSENDKKMIVL